MSACVYETSLDRECGRPSIQDHFCQFHGWLSQLDGMCLEDLTKVTWSDIPELNKIRARLIGAMK